MITKFGYYWFPDGTSYCRAEALVEGDVIAWDHDAWEVLRTWDVPEARIKDGRGLAVEMRPMSASLTAPKSGARVFTAKHRAPVDRFTDRHYPVCVRCGQPTPCREVMLDRQVKRVTENAARYEVAGVCPGCSEVVTHRQKSVCYPENLLVPNGPPVTFHTRQRCGSELDEYDDLWAKHTGASLVSAKTAHLFSDGAA